MRTGSTLLERSAQNGMLWTARPKACKQPAVGA